MHINNLNYDKIEYKGTKIERQVTMKELINQFYALVRQNMPLSGDFDDIKMQLKEDDEGEYNILVHTFLNNRTNEYTNCLNVSYTPNDKDFELSMNLMDGTKQEILDFLGNESNINRIESYMDSLKRRSDEK